MCDPIISGFPEDELDAEVLHRKFLQEYPDASESINPNLPPAVYNKLPSSIFLNSDHAHDMVTRRSITGLLIFVGRTPVHAISKRQGAVETSMYGAEFAAMKMAIEEAIAMRYMLRCLGVYVEHTTRIYGDNAGVILNATIPSSLLKKKHVALSYHMTREAVASGIAK